MAEFVRAILFLPVRSENERSAYLLILNHLRSRHPGSGHPEPIGGFTTSTDDPAPFIGYYWSERLGEWIDDAIALLVIDLPADRKADVATIKGYVEKTYREEGATQDEVWCTLERIELA